MSSSRSRSPKVRRHCPHASSRSGGLETGAFADCPIPSLRSFVHRLRTFLLAFLCLVIPAVAAVTPLTYHPVARFDYEAYGAITFVRRPGDPVHYGFSTQGGNDGIGSFFRMEEKGGVLPLFSFPLGIVGRPTGPVAVDANGDIYGLALSEKQYPTATDETKLY